MSATRCAASSETHPHVAVVHGPTTAFTGVFDGKSNSTDAHFSGPVLTHCETSPSGPVSFPGVAQKLAVNFPFFA